MSDKAPGLPPRQRPAETVAKTQEQLIQEAPLQTAPAEQTNKVPNKPWLDGVGMTEEQLYSLTNKESYNLPLVRLLELNYIMNQKRSPVVGKKINKTMLIAEALYQYNKRELKKLGYDI